MKDFECDMCGKGLVELPGQWCSSCQEKEYYEELRSQGIWLSRSRLCQQCSNADGGDSSDMCTAYGMRLYMVARKNKCKHFNEVNWSEEQQEAWY